MSVKINICETNGDISIEKKNIYKTGKYLIKKKKIPICERPMGRIMRIITISGRGFNLLFVVFTQYIFTDLKQYVGYWPLLSVYILGLASLSLYLYIFSKNTAENRFKWLNNWGTNPIIIVLKVVGLMAYVLIMQKILF